MTEKKKGSRKSLEKMDAARRASLQLKPGPECNGFASILEAPALRCAEQNVHPLTLPQEALIFEPAPEDIVCAFKNGDKERKIHNNIELDETEKKSLELLQQEAKAQGVTFLPSIAAMATRFLSRARGDPKKAVLLMQATQAWRMEYFEAGPVSDDQVMEDLKHGIVYFTGRDSSLRPTIVVRPRRIPQEWFKLKCIDRMIRVLIFCMEYMLWYMLIPGRIENTNVIVDLKGLGVTQLPISALNDIYKVMSHHYIGRVFRFYVVNLSWTLSAISGAVKALLTDRQKQKLVILDDVKELKKDFALHQLEDDLGGTQAVVKEFFPFNMPPSPFEASCSSGASSKSIQGAHAALAETSSARQGILWDSQKSKSVNCALEYSPEARAIFERCNYPIPQNCPTPGEAKEADVNQFAPPPRRLSQKQMRASLKEMGITTCDFNLGPDEEPPDDQGEEPDKTTGLQPIKAPELADKLSLLDSEPDDDSRAIEEEPDTAKVEQKGWWCRSCSR